MSEFLPHADILNMMEKTTLTFGYLGSTTAFLAIAGFSIWVPLSLTLLGLQMLKIAWRNPTMHIVRHYDPSEAEDVFRAVRAFMVRLSKRFSE